MTTMYREIIIELLLALPRIDEVSIDSDSISCLVYDDVSGAQPQLLLDEDSIDEIRISPRYSLKPTLSIMVILANEESCSECGQAVRVDERELTDGELKDLRGEARARIEAKRGES